TVLFASRHRRETTRAGSHRTRTVARAHADELGDDGRAVRGDAVLHTRGDGARVGGAAEAAIRAAAAPRVADSLGAPRFTPRRAARRDDILFGASYAIPLRYGGRSVVSIQGIYEGQHAEPGPFWHRLRFSALYKASARRADLVLANSRSTRDDIVAHYGVDPA